MKGIVFRSTGSWYDVKCEDGKILACRLRGTFKQKALKVTNPIAVGDQVTIAPDERDDQQGIITDILPRDNYMIRQSTRKTAHAHIIAANIDLAALVVTLSYPRTSMGFIDRFLISAEAFRLPALLIFNKQDIMTEEEHELCGGLSLIYENLGYKCLTTSAEQNEGIDALKEYLQDKTTLLSGHSGVGKSTLLNHIYPKANQKTGAVSEFSNKGKHTTTFAEMFEIAQNTFLIDTPGIKEMGLFDVGADELSDYFPEMRALIGNCKFHNCTHTKEPGCAVKAAVEEGQIFEARYESYLSIFFNEDNRK